MGGPVEVVAEAHAPVVQIRRAAPKLDGEHEPECLLAIGQIEAAVEALGRKLSED
jgi:hypothetical protein